MNTLWSLIAEQFNSRELATIFWLLVALVWLFRNQRVRESLRRLIGTLLHRKILVISLLLVTYVSFIVFGLKGVGIWTASNNLKDTMVWVVTVGFGMVMNVSDVSREEDFFRKALKDSLKITIVLEFIIGFYPFSLPVELVLVPVLTLLVATVAVAEMDEEHLLVKRLLTWLLAFVGVFFLWHSIRNLLADVDTVLRFERLIELILPSVLTILFLPFLYFLALFSAYENTFLRLEIRNSDSEFIGYAKRRLFLRFGLNLRKLMTWSKQNPDLSVSNKDEVLELVGKTIRQTDRSPSNPECSERIYRQLAEPLMKIMQISFCKNVFFRYRRFSSDCPHVG